MMYLALLVLSIVSLAHTEDTEILLKKISSKIEEIDPAELVIIGDHQYYIGASTFYVTATEGNVFCNDIGMVIVSLDTKNKTQLIYDYLDSIGSRFFSYWTSGRRLADTWIWSSNGRIFSYTNWSEFSPAPNYPGADDPCVVLNPAYGWQDISCDASMNSRLICE